MEEAGEHSETASDLAEEARGASDPVIQPKEDSQEEALPYVTPPPTGTTNWFAISMVVVALVGGGLLAVVAFALVSAYRKGDAREANVDSNEEEEGLE